MVDKHPPRGTPPPVLPRAASAALARAMTGFPVVVVSGARQTGKSTLVRSEPALRDRPYLTLDDLAIRDQARRDPESLLARAPTLVLDEVQRVPDLLLAVKRAVDEERPRTRGRFVLTGSANLLLMERVSESLAGRAAYLTLWSLTRRERLGLGRTGPWSELLSTPPASWPALLEGEPAEAVDWRVESAIGGLPTPAHELDTADARALWFDAYVTTYLERDLQALASIENLGDFRRLMVATAHLAGTTLNQAEVARDLALPRASVHRWLNLLETSFQLVRLPAYATNRTRRLVKSPKSYWSDVGLARHLSGAVPGGEHLEHLVLLDLVVWKELVTPRPEVMFWRTASGDEVDFVVEHRGQLLAIEVKATTKPTYADARHLRTFRDEYGKALHGALLLHGGTETFWLDKHVLATPWWRVA